MDILCLGKAGLYNIKRYLQVKNELFSDSYRNLKKKKNTVTIAVSEDFNQNLKYN